LAESVPSTVPTAVDVNIRQDWSGHAKRGVTEGDQKTSKSAGKMKGKKRGKHTLEMNLVKVITSHELNVHNFPNSGCIWSPVDDETPTKRRGREGVPEDSAIAPFIEHGGR
jgi:hypothetical protein